MDSLGLFNLVEEYIAKINFKIDEVEQLSEAAGLAGSCILGRELEALSIVLNEHKNKLEDILDYIERDNKDDCFFIAHNDHNHIKKISE